ncbi:MAG: succinyldiaminopimelate transaminase [Woeseiaceae bacterium]
MSHSALNPGFAALQPYPFEKLAKLIRDVKPADLAPIALSIGEPKHAPPDFVLDTYRKHLLEGVSRYPSINGLDTLRQSAADWLQRRFNVEVDAAQMVQPVNGTREGLFAFAQAFIDPKDKPLVLMPNPFYQIYEGAALMAGATPYYLNVSADQNFLPDLDAIAPEVLQRTRIFYLCSPVNPCGSVAPLAYLRQLVEMAKTHDFIIAADECYIELYRDQPPVSILNACPLDDRIPFERVVAFHSLSKRSNLPGLRSGFVAGDPTLIADFRRYRTYHGCSMSLAVQEASQAAWSDDTHVSLNREQYNDKFRLADERLSPLMDFEVPAAAFYLWPNVSGSDETFCRDLYRAENVLCVPGSYLSRDTADGNPGSGFVRMSLVADLPTTDDAIQRIARFLTRG